MWHPIAFVAESRRVDAEALAAFAVENEDKYGIVIESRGPEVNTWHVDKLVADFKALQIIQSQAQAKEFVDDEDFGYVPTVSDFVCASE